MIFFGSTMIDPVILESFCEMRSFADVLVVVFVQHHSRVRLGSS